MKKRPVKHNENQKGMISLMFAGILAVVISMVIGQIVLNQLNLNAVHSNTRNQIIINQRLSVIALRLKEAFNQAQVGLACPGGTENRTINGGNFCLPADTSLCTNLTKVINGEQIVERACTSLRSADMRWDDSASGNESLSVDPSSTITTGTRNRIRVPALTNSLWKSCQLPNNVCLRIILCRSGALDCRINTAEAYQVVRF